MVVDFAWACDLSIVQSMILKVKNVAGLIIIRYVEHVGN